MNGRRGQAVAEVLVLAPLVAACMGAFALAALQLSAMARAEAALSAAIAADAGGGSVSGALAGRGRLIALTPARIAIEVRGPLGGVRRSAERIR